jgi:hypothetical protein
LTLVDKSLSFELEGIESTISSADSAKRNPGEHLLAERTKIVPKQLTKTAPISYYRLSFHKNQTFRDKNLVYWMKKIDFLDRVFFGRACDEKKGSRQLH